MINTSLSKLLSHLSMLAIGALLSIMSVTIVVAETATLPFGAAQANPTEITSASILNTIKNYMVNQGLYGGVDVTTPPNPPLLATLFDSKFITNYRSDVIQALLGDRLPNTPSEEQTEGLLPGSYNAISKYTYLNQIANQPFAKMASPTSTMMPGISDPVTATLFTNLTTATSCPSSSNNSSSPCSALSDIMIKLLGNEAITKYGAPNMLYNNNPVIKQTSSGTEKSANPFLDLAQGFNVQHMLNKFLLSNQDASAPGDSSLQNYANLILLLSHPATAESSFSIEDYNTVYTKAIGIGAEPDPTSQSIILRFLYQTLTNAAYKVLPINNLYNAAAIRAPIQTANGTTSRALTEYLMATWRLTPDQPNKTDAKTDTSWATQINNASIATVLKESALLLSEINYQLYLNRQMQEQMLLTESLLVLQNAATAQTNTSLDFGENAGNASDSSDNSDK